MVNNMLLHALEHAQSVAIAGHMRPDGDCVGSCMGLYHYIRTWYPQIDVDVYLEEIPDSFHFIQRTEEISHQLKEKEYDLFVALDCGDSKRLGFAEKAFSRAQETICVDHHIINDAYGVNNYIKPDASSTSELVYELLDKEKITKEVAECLYLGIVHDTGVFQYTCTAPQTMIVAADLMSKGIAYSRIITDTFYEKTYVQNQILGRALLESVLFMEGQCIASVITKETMDFYGATPKDLEGIVSQLRVTKGVKVTIFMYETEPGEYKISLRSDSDVDVSKIASHFGGGGHQKAAGITMKGSANDIIHSISEKIAAALAEVQEEQ